MNVLFTICGRAGSKGIHNKNIRSFVGYPLPIYTVSAIDLFIKNSGNTFEKDIALNTDSPELVSLIDNNGLREIEVIKRKPELGGDTVAKIAVIRDCFVQMQQKMDKYYDVVIDLDITSPLRTPTDIGNVLKKHSETNADVTTTVTTARRSPYFNQLIKAETGYKKVIDSKYTARQQAPEVFDMNASIYAYKPSFLMSGKGILDGYCECVHMYDTGILDLDHENDFELMEIIAKHLFDRNTSYAAVYRNIRRRSSR